MGTIWGKKVFDNVAQYIEQLIDSCGIKYMHYCIYTCIYAETISNVSVEHMHRSLDTMVGLMISDKL